MDGAASQYFNSFSRCRLLLLRGQFLAVRIGGARDERGSEDPFGDYLEFHGGLPSSIDHQSIVSAALHLTAWESGFEASTDIKLL